MKDSRANAAKRADTLAFLKYSEDLPTLPDRFSKIQQVIADEHADARALAAVIRTDQATAAMVLKFANAPAFNPSHTPIAELPTAIARLGFGETARIALAMSLFYGLMLPAGIRQVHAFWIHAFAVALVSEKISRRIDPAAKQRTHESVYMAGLLHDIGRAALGLRVDFDYFERNTGHLHGSELIAAEQARYGVDHAEAGMYMLRHWRLPEELCLAVAEHHAQAPSTLLGRICRYADGYAHRHIEAADFESVPLLLREALARHPIAGDGMPDLDASDSDNPHNPS